jgi:preprotein translocase subunit Sss1
VSEQELAKCLKSFIAVAKTVMTARKPDGTEFSKVCSGHQMALTFEILKAEAALEALTTTQE